MTAFELILLITMGDLIQQGVTQEDMSITGAFLAVGTITFWIVVIAYLGFRFKAVRPAIEGVPVIVLRHGRPPTEVLRVERVTVEELRESARNHGIEDLDEVELAVLEPDGRFSFLQTSGEAEQVAPEKHKT